MFTPNFSFSKISVETLHHRVIKPKREQNIWELPFPSIRRWAIGFSSKCPVLRPLPGFVPKSARGDNYRLPLFFVMRNIDCSRYFRLFSAKSPDITVVSSRRKRKSKPKKSQKQSKSQTINQTIKHTNKQTKRTMVLFVYVLPSEKRSPPTAHAPR